MLRNIRPVMFGFKSQSTGGIVQDQKRAEYHAGEAERLLVSRFGIITNMVKAGVHATLAVYYSASATPKS
jgi:hypothetical protein